jgi:hypothetical protein
VSALRVALHSWSGIWRTNWRRIALYTAINLAITLCTEAVSRTLGVHLGHEASDYGFLVPLGDGGWAVHRQSQVNLWMTFFASMFGGLGQ